MQINFLNIGLRKTVLAVALLLALTSQAQAITLSGQVEEIAPPPSNAQFGQFESNDFARFWVEQLGVVIGGPLSVDVIPFQNNPSGIYDSGLPGVQATWAGILGADHLYNSYFLHADKDGALQVFSGSITFDFPIAGIIFKGSTLNATDAALGAPGTLYANGDLRTFELDSAINFFTISPDLKTLSFETRVPHDIDNIRIVTHAPEPSSMALLGLGIAGVISSRRRRAKAEK